MAQNPKYDNDIVNLGYLNKRLEETEESINDNNNSILQLPKNYSTPPNPPYYKDSLLCYENKIYRCNTTKLKGEFSWKEWSIVATDDTTITDFINNTYEVEKLKIQEQIDGKVQTYYQETDPALEWGTDLEKNKHIGDYWYNTTDNTQWRYNQITTSSPITYEWGQVNVPKAVFDVIDTKKSIYTTKPTSYQKDDLWIIEETLSDEDLPVGTEENPIAKGDWVFSIANSDTYNKNHWIKRDEDISMSYIKEHYYTTKEIDSSFEEVERNTDSKITKVKDEISLNVAQNYTTKKEHTKAINDFDKQIGTMNETITTHGETISDLSVEVCEITSTVESIETTTKELETDIQEVSADFEDFKDNEYIQSIDNLQKQIDGAIQFWNGAEIPTINNYPANEWATENDKINHQADIYTVVQDVEGEMKQGKSYRFDKIDGVWKWIELTDNELSAVQAIAQEALDKANVNTTDINTIKTNVSTLQQTDEEIKASVASTNKKIDDLESVEEKHYSELTLKNDEISSEVGKKIGSEEVVSSINQSAEQITLKGNRVVIESDNFELTADGTIKATAGEIAGFNTTEEGFYYLLRAKKDYTQDDITKLANHIYQGGTLTDEEKELYDVNNDGVLNLVDIMKIAAIMNSNIGKTYPGKFQIKVPKEGEDPFDAEVGIYDGEGKMLNGFGYNKLIANGQAVGDGLKVSATQPTTGEKVWFQKSNNLFNDSFIDSLGGNISYSNGVFQQIEADTNATDYYIKFQKYLDGTYLSQIKTISYSSLYLGRVWVTFTKDSTFNKLVFGFNGSTRDTVMSITLNSLENGKTYTLSFNLLNITQGSFSWNEIQLEEGNSATPYEPSVSNKIYTKNGNGVYEEFCNQETYSTGEQRIGTWIDEKPLYRQVLYSSQRVEAGARYMPNTAIPNIEVVTDVDVTIGAFGYASFKNHWSNDGGTMFISTQFDKDSGLYISADYTGFIGWVLKVEYTKTTD